jgi:hypothetical protein
MRTDIFKSESRRELRAFAGNLIGDKLPKNHAPWTATGVIGSNKAPLSRDTIEKVINAEGFQLWRTRKRAQAQA